MLDIIPEYLQFVKRKETECELGIIHTFSVKATNEKGQLSGKSLKLDDYTYKNYPELVELVPRGFSILVDRQGKEICRLQGLPKFDASSIDDDSGVENHLIDFNLINTWKTNNELEVSFQEKANGKFLTFIILENGYIFGGSKNVHRLYKMNEEIVGNKLHDRMMKQVFIDCKTKRFPVNQTIFAEYCDGKHIVYEDNPYITFFYPKEISNVRHIFPTQNVLPTEEQYNYIRQMQNTEGCVIVFRNVMTNEIFRQKFKSIWYIIIRVIREQLSKNNTSEISSSFEEKILKTIKKRSDDFIHLTEKELEGWFDTTRRFIRFMVRKQYVFSSVSNMSPVGMAVRWHEFSSEHEHENQNELTEPTLKIEKTQEKQEKQKNNVSQLLCYGNTLIEYNFKVCFVLRGVSGSGKSTLSHQIKQDYPNNCEIFSTDTYFETEEGYQFDASKLGKYHNLNYEKFSKSNSQILIVDNMNMTRKEYEKYIQNAKNRGYITIIKSFPILSLEDYLSRSTHIDDIFILDNQLKRYKSVKFPVPSYYGIFVDRNLKIFNSLSIKQTTPLHITCALGFENENNPCMNFGLVCKFNINGLNTNKAGRCLIITLNEEFKHLYKLNGIPHITLETFENYKPVDVGKNILFGNTETFENKENMIGIYGPIF